MATQLFPHIDELTPNGLNFLVGKYNFSEKFGAVVIGRRCFHLIPRAVMRNNGVVSAFIEIGANHLVAMRIMLMQKCVGYVKHYRPSAHRLYKSLYLNIREEIKALSCSSAGADANERGANGIHLNVYVLFIIRIGNEEKLKAAINANGFVGFHGGYFKRPFVGDKAHRDTVVGMNKLSFSFIRRCNTLPNAIEGGIFSLLPASVVYKKR